MHVKIELPAGHTITSRDLSVTVDLTKLSPELIARAALHGLTQKIADAAAGAAKVAGEGASPEKVAATGQALMQKVVDQLEAGEWGRQRSAGDGRGAHWKFVRAIVRDALTGDNAAGYKAIPSDDQAARAAYLDSLFDGLADDKRALIEDAAREAFEEEKARKAKLGKLKVAI